KRWMSHHRMPACTRIVRAPGLNSSTRLQCRMSRCRLPGLAVCPPMLKWPPPIETGRLDCASAARTSSAYLGTTTDDTATGLSRVTSLTITCGGSGRFMDAHLQVIAGAAARVLAVPFVTVRAPREQQLAGEDDGAKHRYQRQQQPPCGKLPVVQASHRQRKQHGEKGDTAPACLRNRQ